MKKLLLILSILLLSGCFENSGYLTKKCFKKEIANSLEVTTTITFGFKNDEIDKVNILYNYSDTLETTISSIKTSVETQNKYLRLPYNVLIDEKNNYKIEYDIDINSSQEILDKFNIKKAKTEFIKDLKEKGFSCE